MQGNHQQAADLAALWQQCQEAGAAAEAWCKGDRDFHQAPTYERYIVAYDALKAARPTDLLGIAAQLEWAADWIGDGGGDPGDEEILEHMAQSLKALVLRPVPVVTDAMVAAGMEAEIAHRHVSAEQRVRAMLADALSAMPPVEDDQTALRLWEEYKAAALRTSAAQDAEDQAIVQYGPHSEQRFAAGLLVKERGAEEDTAETAVGMNEPTTLPAIVVQLRLLAEMILVSVPEYAPLCLKVLAAVERMAGMEADPYLERYGVGEA